MLDQVTSVSELHDSSPLLFWTILRISAYRRPQATHIFELTAVPYRNLLMCHLYSIMHDFRTIQAIILLCHWPNSGPRQSQDASWQYCGAALNAALQMGLNQPRPEKIALAFQGKSNAHEMSAYSRHMTWLACFSASTSLSVWLGVPPHLSSPAQLDAVSSTAKEPGVPPPYMVHIEIQRQVVQYSIALAGQVDTSTTSTLLNLFSNELDNVLRSHKSTWSRRLEVQFLGAKLYLYSLCLTAVSKMPGYGSSAASSSVSDPARMSMQLGLPSAISLIHTITQLNKESSTMNPGSGSEVLHYPKSYFRLVVFAVGFRKSSNCVDFSTAQP
jgi:hypothetical protein